MKREKDMIKRWNNKKQQQLHGMKKRTERLDFINKQLNKENHAMDEFDNVDQAMKNYYYITGKQLEDLPPKPTLSDFYIPSDEK